MACNHGQVVQRCRGSFVACPALDTTWIFYIFISPILALYSNRRELQPGDREVWANPWQHLPASLQPTTQLWSRWPAPTNNIEIDQQRTKRAHLLHVYSDFFNFENELLLLLSTNQIICVQNREAVRLNPLSTMGASGVETSPDSTAKRKISFQNYCFDQPHGFTGNFRVFRVCVAT